MKRLQTICKDILVSASILAIAFAGCLWLEKLPGSKGLMSMVLVLAVFLISLVTDGYVYGIAASLLAVLLDNFMFAFPYLAFDFLSVDNLISAIVMLVVAVITCTLTTKIKIQEKIRSEAEREKMRANLLRAISHDLRTPLTTIYGSCSVIMENYDGLPKKQQLSLLGRIREDAENLIQMVENLLSVTRINTEGVKVAKTETVLEELVDTTIVKFRKQYPAQEVEVSIPDAFISIPMDALLIQQVLINLLENAVVHARGMTKLSLRVRETGHWAEFSVTDNGCGIPKERLQRLFEGFFEDSMKPADGGRSGMGIGLSVCATIIKAHGGEIWGGNTKEGGAQISFRLEKEEQHYE